MSRHLCFWSICLSLAFLIWDKPVLDYKMGKIWWGDKPYFSDWRGLPPPDWSTNVPVCDYYTGSHSKSLRRVNGEMFLSELACGDTLLAAFDYYALNISKKFIPNGLLYVLQDSLRRGFVFYYQIYLNDSQTMIQYDRYSKGGGNP